LLLDEPTNHLDMRAKDVLLHALEGFSGTVVFVSHDRYFIDKLATRIFEVDDGHVTVYPGNYEDYLWRKSGGGSLALPALDEAGPVAAPVAAYPAPQPAREPERRLNPIKLRKLEQRRHEIEREVAKLEAEIQDHEQALGNFVNAGETQRVSGLLEAGRQQLEGLMQEWEDVAQAIEANS